MHIISSVSQQMTSRDRWENNDAQYDIKPWYKNIKYIQISIAVYRFIDIIKINCSNLVTIPSAIF